MKDEPIAAMMHAGACGVGLDDRVADVERTLLDRGLSWVPVVESDGTAVGVVSAVDLLRFHAEGRDAAATRAWQLCTYKPITVAPDVPIGAVARRMADEHVHHVVVADANGIRGVVSSMDFVRAYAASGAPARRSRKPAAHAAPVAAPDAAAGDAAADRDEEGPEPAPAETYELADDAATRDAQQGAAPHEADIERAGPEPQDADWIDAEVGRADRP